MGTVNTLGQDMQTAYNTQYVSTPKPAAPPKSPLRHEDIIMGAINPGLQTNHQAPTVGLDGYFRSGQQQLVGQLQGIASGAQQGAGEMAARRQAANAAAQQQAMARMARGGNAALAQRNAANNTAGIGLAGAGMAQQAALQDQASAQGLLSNTLGQGRGADMQTQIANVDAQLRAMGMNDQARLGYLSQLTGIDQSILAAETERYKADAAKPSGGLLGSILSKVAPVITGYALGGPAGGAVAAKATS